MSPERERLLSLTGACCSCEALVPISMTAAALCSELMQNEFPEKKSALTRTLISMSVRMLSKFYLRGLLGPGGGFVLFKNVLRKLCSIHVFIHYLHFKGPGGSWNQSQFILGERQGASCTSQQEVLGLIYKKNIKKTC